MFAIPRGEGGGGGEEKEEEQQPQLLLLIFTSSCSWSLTMGIVVMGSAPSSTRLSVPPTTRPTLTYVICTTVAAKKKIISFLHQHLSVRIFPKTVCLQSSLNNKDFPS
ncbi:hypothetical protein PoB_004337500 [Plakobranchus ocellatus]|uniref:Uncharacterized protein n=1 Tax=Plakobranchus ocellatus TaxID=259542 RepID=A0AAV4B8G4_9GAST|nr:hypothetical protein PoB_004337500 [Plakobranchus ocellatus]